MKIILCYFLRYLDLNNLYGQAQSLNLPCGEYSWVSDTDFVFSTWNEWTEDQPYGYLLEVITRIFCVCNKT